MNNTEKINKMIDITINEMVDIDNNIIQWNDGNDKKYRYKIMKNVVRFEECSSSKIWKRLDSHKISTLSFDSWTFGMKWIRYMQNSI